MRAIDVMMTVVLSMVVLAACSFAFPRAPAYMPDQYFEDGAEEDPDLASFLEEEKRGGSGMRPMPFPCNGYDNVPRCLNGGKGPRKTWTKSGRFCVCLCPTKWIGPECGFAANAMQSKRFPWGLKKF